MKKVLTLSVVALFAGVLCAGCGEGRESAGNTDNTVSKMEEQLNLTQEWDKVFPKSGKVTHSKITFHNRYGVTLAADLYIPKNTDGGKLPAIAVCGPFGAVKEQASGLYSQTLAERGFLTIAFDPHNSRCSPHRPLRQHGKDSFRQDRDFLPRVSEVNAFFTALHIIWNIWKNIYICDAESFRSPALRWRNQKGTG